MCFSYSGDFFVQSQAAGRVTEKPRSFAPVCSVVGPASRTVWEGALPRGSQDADSQLSEWERGFVPGQIMDEDVDATNVAPDGASPREDPAEGARRLAFELRSEPGLEPVAQALEALSLQLDAARRRLVRFGFDLHDGVLQDVAALGTDLHLFHDQLEASLSGHEHAARLAGRVEDVIARLVAIDRSLRELATSAESSSLLRGPLTSMLEAAALSYEGSLSIGLKLDRELDDVALTDSQRIALIRIVQGALANVVQHSGATTATVSARCLSEGIEAEIRDDGTGFDMQPTLRRAADEGRIGLVAMRERARMLGGEFGIESKPGGPTRVRVLLPYWRPGTGA